VREHRAAAARAEPEASEETVPPADAAPDDSALPPAGVEPDEVWPRVKSAAGPRLRGMLDVMSVRSVTPRLLTLEVPAARSAMARDHLDEITRLVQGTGVRGMSIQLVDVKPQPGDEAGGGPPAAAPPAIGPGPDPSASFRHAEDHPLVREAARVFGAKVVHVEPKRGGPG
jgi:pyruvate/2-oxoglutarate dehydrogenase complex dihydrolipoamide acyltransferase (E2) component